MKIATQPGIYSITHVESGRRYVGSAKNISNRLSQHRANLRGGKHFCRHLQNAWKKYGEAAFRLEVLEITLNSQVILLAREQHWIDHFKGRLFNARLIAESTEGCRLNLSDEEREKRRQCAIENFARTPRPKRTNHNLAPGDIPVIFARYAAGDGIKAIARDFKVWLTTISDVIYRRTWDDIPVDPSTVATCRARIGRMGRKLNDDDVRRIKSRLLAGDKIVAIAADYGVSTTAIGFIKRGHHYAHVS